MTSSGGQCLLLESLSPRMEEVVQRAINLTRNVLRRIGTVELEVCLSVLSMYVCLSVCLYFCLYVCSSWYHMLVLLSV